MTSLVLIRGLPGSGKSTTARRSFPNHIHIEADQYFIDLHGYYNFNASELTSAHNQCFKRTKHALLYNGDVVVSNTFTTIKEMERYYALREEIPNLEITIWECTGNFGSIHNVPAETLIKMQKRWQTVPSSWEVHQIESNQ